MRERTQAYHRAVEIEIAAAEEGLLEGEGFPTWADEIRYEPTPTEAAEAGQLFGELASLEEEAEFQAWLEGLHQERFREVTRAIDVCGALAEFHGDLDVQDLVGWMV